MTSVLVPIFICVVLPVSVVLIRAIMNMHTENKRSEVLLKAIEANNCIDADKLAQALAKPRLTPRGLRALLLKATGERASDFRRAVSGHRT